MPKKLPVPPMEQLVTQMRIANALLAAQLQQHMTQQAIVELLRGVGASHQDIADILGTSYASVAVSIARNRKRASKGAEHVEETEGTEPAEADLRETGDGRERQ